MAQVIVPPSNGHGHGSFEGAQQFPVVSHCPWMQLEQGDPAEHPEQGLPLGMVHEPAALHRAKVQQPPQAPPEQQLFGQGLPRAVQAPPASGGAPGTQVPPSEPVAQTSGQEQS
jgi:hypothetical protein